VQRNELSLLNLENIAEAGDNIRYYYYNGTELPIGGFWTNWHEYTCRVTCTNTIGWSSESYEVDLIKCGYGDGDCFFSQTCLLN